MTKNLIFSATYNEKDNIEELIEKINRYSSNSDILMTNDDNSPDGTGNILNKLKKENQILDFLVREGKLGLDTVQICV